ncbi:MAG: hypothetical protein AB7H93_10885 [Vicinamibacterales bacterium]
MVIERQRLRSAMEPEAIDDRFVSLQDKEIKGLGRPALELTLRIIDDAPRLVLAARYRRQAGRGAVDRLVCRVADAHAENFAAVFVRAAAAPGLKEAMVCGRKP